MVISDNINIPDAADAYALADLIDSIMAGGTQHINIETGEETTVRTVNSTDCGKKGACAIPTFDFGDAQ